MYLFTTSTIILSLASASHAIVVTRGDLTDSGRMSPSALCADSGAGTVDITILQAGNYNIKVTTATCLASPPTARDTLPPEVLLTKSLKPRQETLSICQLGSTETECGDPGPAPNCTALIQALSMIQYRLICPSSFRHQLRIRKLWSWPRKLEPKQHRGVF
ncbi:hypothetical protein K439DRAFT_487328 [Ramaria rubella]|nr:hypothetical protein K439DRAFT_487328 [Ramaria rubella]